MTTKKESKPYLVLARKYRPSTFDEVVGQEAIATTLKNAITTNRVAHAYLFAGPRGVGKTSLARIMAKALNCLEAKAATTTPCGACEACLGIARGNDLDTMEFDAASNRGVDDIQTLILDRVDYVPVRCRFKIYIIDEVQQLSATAFDSLLKTLEEPPAHVRFIFATTHPGDIPPTIHSRCQRFDFRRLTPERTLEHLKAVCKKEGVTPAEETLRLVARAAEGGMRDALSILDQVIALGDAAPAEAAALIGAPPDEAFAALLDAVLAKDLHKGFGAVSAAWEGGWDLREFADGFINFLRDHLVAAAGDVDALTWRYAPEVRKTVEARAKSQTTDRWLFLMDRAVGTLAEVRQGLAGRVGLELMFLSMLGQPTAAPVTVPMAPSPFPTPRIVTPSPAPVAARPVVLPSGMPAAVPVSGDQWEAAIEKVGARRMSLAAMLRGTRLVSTEGGTALVQLPADSSTSYLERLNEADKRLLVEEALAGVLGRKLKVRYEIPGLKTEPAAPASPAPAPSTAAPASDPVVQLATKLLAGKVIRRPPPQ